MTAVGFFYTAAYLLILKFSNATLPAFLKERAVCLFSS